MLKSDLVDIPEDYLCPITQELMQNPVVAADGHTYEEKAVVQWLQSGHATSPLTGERLKHKSLTENHRLKAIIAAFREKLPEIQRERQIRVDLDAAIKLREEMIAHDAAKRDSENRELAKALMKKSKENEMLKQHLMNMQRLMQQMQAELEAAQTLINEDRNINVVLAKQEEEEEEEQKELKQVSKKGK